MYLLKMGSHGNDVRSLQARLRRFEPDLASDGIFGGRTERAVRLAQRRLGLFPPDGIAGPETMSALSRQSAAAVPKPASSAGPSLANRLGSAAWQVEGNVQRWLAGPLTGPGAVPAPIRKAVGPAVTRAETAAMPAGEVRSVDGMRMSLQGRRFIIRHEGQRGVSNRLHHPTMGSGVTIGPGYDMKDRTPAEVAGHLRLIGVEPTIAAQAAQGAGKQGQAARQFVHDNKNLFNLSEEKQAALLTHIIGHYESMARRAITIPLHQHEFDAMVSYAYNPGGGWRKTTALVNAHKPDAAMTELSRHVYSKHQRVASLVTRRAAESRMFLYGEYR